tara:strand:- start:2402 stop:2560 length:159 start_codon:yes stop_codon:yes gene_type:complete
MGYENGIENVATDKEVIGLHGAEAEKAHAKFNLSREATVHFRPQRKNGLTNS